MNSREFELAFPTSLSTSKMLYVCDLWDTGSQRHRHDPFPISSISPSQGSPRVGQVFWVWDNRKSSIWRPPECLSHAKTGVTWDELPLAHPLSQPAWNAGYTKYGNMYTFMYKCPSYVVRPLPM